MASKGDASFLMLCIFIDKLYKVFWFMIFITITKIFVLFKIRIKLGSKIHVALCFMVEH